MADVMYLMNREGYNFMGFKTISKAVKLARFLGWDINYNVVKKWIYSEQFPAVRASGVIYVDVSLLLEFLCVYKPEKRCAVNAGEYITLYSA